MNGSHYEYYQLKQRKKPQPTLLERIQEVSRANRKPTKLKWTDLPDGVLQLLKELGVYPKKKSYGNKK